MEIFLSFIFDVLIGRHTPLKQYAAAIGVVVLAFIAAVTFFGYNASSNPDSFYLPLAIVSAIGTIAAIIWLIKWRFQQARHV